MSSIEFTNVENSSQITEPIYESIYDEIIDPYSQLRLPYVPTYVDLNFENTNNTEVKSSKGKFCFRYFPSIMTCIFIVLIVLIGVTVVVLAVESKKTL